MLEYAGQEKKRKPGLGVYFWITLVLLPFMMAHDDAGANLSTAKRPQVSTGESHALQDLPKQPPKPQRGPESVC